MASLSSQRVSPGNRRVAKLEGRLLSRLESALHLLMLSVVFRMQACSSWGRMTCFDLLRVLCKFHVAERTKNVLSLITTSFSPCNLNPSANFKDCKINMHLCSKNPVQPQGKYLNNNSFICTLGDAVKRRYKGKKGTREKKGKGRRRGERAIAIAMAKGRVMAKGRGRAMAKGRGQQWQWQRGVQD